MSHNYYVYMLANKKNGTLYTGVTGNLLRRVNEHKAKKVDGFTKKYDIDKLVYFEETENVYGALQREKRLKHWKRQWKIALIEGKNPDWRDLYDGLLDDRGSPGQAGG